MPTHKMDKEAFRKEMKQHDRIVAETASDMETGIKLTVGAVREINRDVHRVEGVINNAPAIIHDINIQFEEATKLKTKDIAFLFGAAALQTARWVLLPNIDWKFNKVPTEKRMTSQQGGNIERQGIIDYFKNEGYSKSEIQSLMDAGRIRNYTWQQLLVAPVPYDAMHGSARIDIAGFKPAGKELGGKTHHVATWGHDPIWGWIFGPLNITSRMITFRDFQTFHVMQVGNTRQQRITYRSSLGNMMEKSIKAWTDDNRKLFVSVAKQGMHLASDKYTKGGLPIPFVNADTAQDLLSRGWNSNEIERLFQQAFKNIKTIGAQLGIAIILDNLVKALHLLCYDSAVDGSVGTYSVKTQKIVCFSNALAELANAGYVAATGDVGKIDIGGYINLARNLLNNSKLQSQLKSQFLEKELEKKLYGDEHYFLEV